jgi:hypothetical protein
VACSSETSVEFNELRGVISQKIKLLIMALLIKENTVRRKRESIWIHNCLLEMKTEGVFYPVQITKGQDQVSSVFLNDNIPVQLSGNGN